MLGFIVNFQVAYLGNQKNYILCFPHPLGVGILLVQMLRSFPRKDS